MRSLMGTFQNISPPPNFVSNDNPKSHWAESIKDTRELKLWFAYYINKETGELEVKLANLKRFLPAGGLNPQRCNMYVYIRTERLIQVD